MKKIGKKTLALILALTMALSLMSVTALARNGGNSGDDADVQPPAVEEESPVRRYADSETERTVDYRIGYDVYCTFEEGVLYVWGSGETYDYDYSTMGRWSPVDHVTGLTAIVIEEGITDIGDGVFSYESYVTGVVFPSTLQSIKDYAFVAIGGGRSLSLQFVGKAPEIADNAFSGAHEITAYYPQGDSTWSKLVNSGKTYGAGTFTWVAYNPDGHTWGDIVWDWAEDCSSVTASRTCTLCGEADDSIEVTVKSETFDPTCTADGYTVYTATATVYGGRSYFDSQTVTDEGSALGHDWNEEIVWSWSDDAKSASAARTCDRCGTEESAKAEVESETTSYTCTKDGLTESTATVIFSDGTIATSKASLVLPAAHTPHRVAGYVQTCTEAGLSDGYVCSVCGEILEEQVEIPPDGHTTWSEVTKEPTCTEEGETTYHCWICGASYTEPIDATDHRPVTWKGEEATCTEDGWTDGEICGDCEIVLTEREMIPATGHDYVGDVITPATYEEEGLIVYTCANCGDSYEDVLPALQAELNARSEISGVDVTAAASDEDTLDGYYELLVTEAAKEDLTEDVLAAIEQAALSDPAAEGMDLTPYYLEIDLLKYKNSVDYDLISEIDDFEVEITLSVPSELLDADDYLVVRLHKDAIEVLPVTVNDDGTLTFTSDRFSLYTVYALNVPAEETDDTGSGDNDKESSGETDAGVTHNLRVTWEWSEDWTSCIASVECTDKGCDYEPWSTAATVESETTATCTTSGVTTLTASVEIEGQTVTSDPVTLETPALGHTPSGEGTVILEATETEDGLIEYVCARCGQIYTEIIPALGSETAAIEINDSEDDGETDAILIDSEDEGKTVDEGKTATGTSETGKTTSPKTDDESHAEVVVLTMLLAFAAAVVLTGCELRKKSRR